MEHKCEKVHRLKKVCMVSIISEVGSTELMTFNKIPILCFGLSISVCVRICEGEQNKCGSSPPLPPCPLKKISLFMAEG